MEKKTLVIGASINPERYSNKAIKSLKNKKIETIALGLRKGEVESVTIETEQLLFKEVHTVTLYLNSKRQEDHYEYIISLNPKRVIFNPGTENPEFYKLLEKNNIETEIACTLVLLATNQY
ncbi:CoA-binding protein [Aurantibacter sp.]|uniref:CoA-binding protein n=1 Tax=Aurantibacter sp. TaxID=2807103 RepID=UPI0035C82CA2